MRPNRYQWAIRRAMVAALGMTVSGLMVSWFVGSALVAPCDHEIGDPPPELHATSFTIASDSGSMISGWHTRPPSSHGVVVLLHGIRSSRLAMVDRARMLHESGYATVLIDLQAHGESTGNAITIGHLEKHDVRAAVEFARREHPDEPIGVVGVSLGGAAAVLASPLDIDALVLESVYPSIRDAIHNRVAARLGPLSSIPTALLLIHLRLRLGIAPSDLRPIDHMRQIDCPVCVISGTVDRHTTVSETKTLYSAACEPKELWLVDGAAHVDLLRVDPIEYRERVVGFIDRHLRNGGIHGSELSRETLPANRSYVNAGPFAR